MYNKINIIVADDNLKERKEIIDWVEKCFHNADVTINEFSRANKVIEQLDDSENSFDFIFTDIEFKFDEDPHMAGKRIAERALKLKNKPRVVLLSGKWLNGKILQLPPVLRELTRVPKDESTDQDMFNELVAEDINHWSSFKCSQASYRQRIELLKALANTQDGGEIVAIGNENWRLKDLFPLETWNGKTSVNNYQRCARLLIKYPLVDKDIWLEANPENAVFTLAIKDYYDELYFNPKYGKLLNKIATDAMKLLELNFRYFIYEILNDTNQQKQLQTELLRSRNLYGSYMGKLGGEDANHEISNNDIVLFAHKLTGRLAAIGSYLFLDFEMERIYSIIKDGSYEYTGMPTGVRQMFSQDFFIIGTGSKSDGHKRYKKYQPIFCCCSQDEQDLLRQWWNEMNKWMRSNLSSEQITAIEERVTQCLTYLDLDAPCDQTAL